MFFLAYGPLLNYDYTEIDTLLPIMGPCVDYVHFTRGKHGLFHCCGDEYDNI